MALQDLQAFLQQRAVAYDPTIDVTSGSPFDVQVIQPVLSRLGTDPFSVDMGVFIQDRLTQEFPGMSTKEGDSITDLLIKPAVVLWDPIVRENLRVKQNLSFKDPTLLTLDEADALGANLFATRNTGDTAFGVARVYFSQPQNISITPANFISSQGGLNFFPTETQSISVQEMLFNVENGLYYFDVNAVAEAPGDQYNIDPDQLISIANVGAAVLVTNKLRFLSGDPAEDAPTFISRVEQQLTEHSMVTEAGIIQQIGASFSEVTRLAVTGFQDPEMQRDIITGGGLGAVISGGLQASVIPDGQNQLLSRRIKISPAEVATLGLDFTALIGPVGTVDGSFTITLHSALPSGYLPLVNDYQVVAVVAPDTLDLSSTVLFISTAILPWSLREDTLTLSGIPGGILFPNGPGGTLTVPPNTIHIGGATDIFVRANAFDSGSLIITDVVDDQPLFQGTELTVPASPPGGVVLGDYTMSGSSTGNYNFGDATYTALQGAVGLTLEILDPPDAGSYRVLSVTQTGDASPVLVVTPSPTVVTGDFRWRLLDEIFIDLVEPKETRIAGSDLTTVQGTNVVSTLAQLDFGDLGVSPGDVLRITTGSLIMGDYNVIQVLTPFFTRIQVDRNLPATITGASYYIFRPNADGGLTLPFVRIDSIALLDTSNQPVGSNIPYAKPIDIQSASFANAAHGIKADFYDATLGCMTQQFTGGVTPDLGGLTLSVALGNAVPLFSLTFTTGTTSLTSAAAQVNAAASVATAGSLTNLAVILDLGRRLGLTTSASFMRASAGTAIPVLFGNFPPYTSRDIRSASTNFSVLRPAIDLNFDVAQVLDGLQIGFYDQTTPNVHILNTEHDFFPEVGRHVQVGARSLGTARLYFLEPTSIEFDEGSIVTLTGSDGSILNYLPDPTLNYQRIPALPTGTKPMDGVSVMNGNFSSASSDFIQTSIAPGDLLVIDFIPLIGTATLGVPSGYVAGLSGLNLILSIGGGNDKVVTFITDSSSIPAGAVTVPGIASLINRAVGSTIAIINASNQLQFNPTSSLVVRGTGSANTLLGFPAGDTSNASANANTYVVQTVVDTHTLTLTTPLSFSESNEQFSVFRTGVQRIVSTTMSAQVAETGLYYWDLQLISQGTGDQYNIAASLQMTAAGYKSDGYYLTTDDPNLTFSPVERPKLHISPTILEIGVTDDPNNATQISGQNIQVNYDQSIITQSVQNFVLSDTERVINESPLVRHLIPYFVRADIGYVGGSQTSVVSGDINTLILGLFPSDTLNVSALEQILTNDGATEIDNPLTLLAVIHNFDRSVTVERSQDKLNVGRLASFFPDVINLTRGVG